MMFDRGKDRAIFLTKTETTCSGITIFIILSTQCNSGIKLEGKMGDMRVTFLHRWNTTNARFSQDKPLCCLASHYHHLSNRQPSPELATFYLVRVAQAGI